MKLKYRAMSLKESVDSIHGFLNPYKGEWDWSKIIYDEYPEIKKTLKGAKTVGDKKNRELTFFEDYISENNVDLGKSAKSYQQHWNKIGDRIFLTLGEIVETNWNNIPNEVIGRVSLNPINPRDINNFNFDLYFRHPIQFAMAVSIHEIFHFIYFKKWFQLFPDTRKRELDAPHLVWQLSEMVPGIVLNDDRIQKIFKHKFNSYDIYENAELDGKPLLSYLQDFYHQRKNFGAFLKISWKFVQRNQEFIQAL